MKVARPVRRAGQGNPPRRKAGRAPWSDPYTYVPTWAGVVYVAFVIDAFSRRVLGWRAAMSMHTELVLDTLEMAIWTRAQAGLTDLTGLVHHTDAGSKESRSWLGRCPDSVTVSTRLTQRGRRIRSISACTGGPISPP